MEKFKAVNAKKRSTPYIFIKREGKRSIPLLYNPFGATWLVMIHIANFDLLGVRASLLLFVRHNPFLSCVDCPKANDLLLYTVFG